MAPLSLNGLTYNMAIVRTTALTAVGTNKVKVLCQLLEALLNLRHCYWFSFSLVHPPAGNSMHVESNADS